MKTVDGSGVRAVVFDMDGTLLNTEVVIVGAASQALQSWGYAPLPEGYRMPNMHGTAADLMVDVLHERGLPLPAQGKAAAGAAFEACYARYPAGMAPLYPGVRACLQALKEEGLALAVCTNKVHTLALKGLEAHGILALFEVVTGRDSCGIAKPAPEPLWHTLAQLDVAPAQALYVGDTHVDAACAQAAGTPFAWFSAGFGDARVAQHPQALSFADYTQLPHGWTALQSVAAIEPAGLD